MARYADLVAAAAQVAATSKRSDKVGGLAAYLRTLSPADAPLAVGLLLGRPRQGRLGVGWSTVTGISPGSSWSPGGGDQPVTVSPAGVPTLNLADIDDAFGQLAGAGGAGSQAARAAVLHQLFARATAAEQRHLRHVLLGEMRQGANDGVLTDALAKASGLALDVVRRAAMLLGDLGETAARALAGESLDAIGLQPLVGVQPMLATTATTVTQALAETGPASVEAKLDGARIQVHRLGGHTRVFTRSLREISAAVPEIVAAVAGLADGLVLDGEALGLDEDGDPLAFQDSMSGSARLRPFFFDVLHADGQSLIDRPLVQRRAALKTLVPAALRLDSIDAPDAAAAEAFAAAVLARGHEGVMVKALDSTYAAGRRGKAWRKVKPVHTLDLVVLGAEWGSGRRQGWLSNLHLGAADGDGGFVMVGKTFKGLTDELLRWQTAEFQRLTLATDGYVVQLRPELVVEIALDGAQRSSRYPGGVALRFARVRRYRQDKTAAEADHIDRVRALLPGR